MQLYEIWIQKIDRPGLKEKPVDIVRKSYRVCNAHFGPEAQYIGVRHKSTIKKDAIPSLLLPGYVPPSKFLICNKSVI